MGKVTYPDGSTPRICIIGAGYAGLTAGIQLKRILGLNTFTIFEKNSDLGGVWFSNCYPGCAVDAPVHFYSWSFEPNPDWSLKNAPQPEILEYMKSTAKKYDLYPHMKFHRVIQSMTWEKRLWKWRVAVLNLKDGHKQDLFFDFVITAMGPLSDPKIPAEFTSFRGPMMHSAKWDSSVDLKDKVVSVVGSGSSAVQIIPALVGTVKHLHCYQRNSTWVFPCPRTEYSRFVKWIFRYIPLIMKFYRWYLFWKSEKFHKVVLANSADSHAARKLGYKAIESQTEGHPEIQAKLKPNYTVGCSMVSKSSVYYKALTEPNVTLHTDHIAEVREDSIVTKNGTMVKPDVLILATGFQFQNYLSGLPIIGTHSADIIAEWRKDRPKNYYGICTHQAPNNFILLGPHGNLGHTSSLFIMECQVTFVIELLRKMMKGNFRRFDVKLSAQNECMEKLDKMISKTVWGTEDCSSFYRNARGMHTIFFAGNGVDYWRRTRSVNLEHFDLA